VFVEYGLPGGRLGFVGIECKLTESFSQGRYSFAERYSRWMDKPDWFWKVDADQSFSNVHYNQLWRNHLLAFAMFHQPGLKYDEARCAVVYHDDDLSCTNAIDAYCQHLRPEVRHTLLRWPLRTVMAAWSVAATAGSQRAWLAAFRRRCVDLSESDEAWSRR
jgi:hypothetical protein